MDNDFRAGFFIGIMTMVVAILIAALLAACGPDFGTFAQVAVETPTPVVQPAEIDEPGHEVLMREYTTWHGASTDTVCMVTMRSNCAARGAWRTPPASPRRPVHDQRAPAPTVPPECIV